MHFIQSISLSKNRLEKAFESFENPFRPQTFDTNLSEETAETIGRAEIAPMKPRKSLSCELLMVCSV